MVGVAIVTYADRRSYLQKVVEKLLSIKEIGRIHVVGNNTSYSLVECLEAFHSQVISYTLFDKNTGSAQGYKTGIEQLMKLPGIDFIWLLDDDNLPHENALNSLLEYWRSTSINKGNDALMSLRTDRPYLVQVAHGKPVKHYFPKRNAFLGFHLFRIHEFFFKKLFAGYNKNKKQVASIPCAPYGGLFFHKDLIHKIGYPDERFFVYADDYEFTYRITKSGGNIMLIPASEIDDLEKTWFNRTKHGVFHSRFLQQNDFRSYLSIRNTVYLQNKCLVTKRLLYNVNTFFFMLHIYLLAVAGNKMKQYRNFRKAVRDGNSGNFDNTYIYEK